MEMIRKHIAGDANPLGWKKAEGGNLTRDEIMVRVHELTEAWVVKHRALSMTQVIALGQQARAATLTLLGELTDSQLGEKLPGAPWADGTMGGVLSVNADHARMHWAWLTAGLEAAAGAQASAGN